nr:unnamed protein product [Callosobruchus chinensis]
MEYFDDKIENKDVFKDQTTYRNDYKKYHNYKRDLYRAQKWRLEKPAKSKPEPAYSDNESFDRWKDDASVPTTLFIEPKPIIRTSPQDRFVKLDPSAEEVEDHGKQESIKTRPRKRGDHEFQKIVPEINAIETTDTVTLKVDQYLPIPEQYRDKGKNWDDEQIRGHADPTRDFWIHKDPPVVCGACVDPLKFIVSDEQKVVISNLIAKEKLRQPHDLLCPTHTGYKPMLATGVSLGKKQIAADHPMMTTNQAVTYHLEEEMRR